MSNCSRCKQPPMMCVCDAQNVGDRLQQTMENLLTASACGECGMIVCRCGAKTKVKFDWSLISPLDTAIALRYIDDLDRAPDLVIDSEHSGPYLWRWHVVPRNDTAGVYFHIQTSSDPERPLHDHPWDNMSVILAGGYDEVIQAHPPTGDVILRELRRGHIAMRKAEHSHRLILPPQFKYTMTQFSMAGRRRGWGFWIDGRWFPYQQCCRYEGNRTLFRYPPGIDPDAAFTAGPEPVAQ